MLARSGIPGGGRRGGVRRLRGVGGGGGGLVLGALFVGGGMGLMDWKFMDWKFTDQLMKVEDWIDVVNAR